MREGVGSKTIPKYAPHARAKCCKSILAGYSASAEDEEGGELLSVQASAQQLGVSDSTLYRWHGNRRHPAQRPPGSVRRTGPHPDEADFRSGFRLGPPEGFVSLREAMRRLGVSRRTIWQRSALPLMKFKGFERPCIGIGEPEMADALADIKVPLLAPIQPPRGTRKHFADPVRLNREIRSIRIFGQRLVRRQPA